MTALRSAWILPLLAGLGRAACADVFNMPPGQTSVQFVTVGDPGNLPDTTVMQYDTTTGYGSVPYAYQIGKYVLAKSAGTADKKAAAASMRDHCDPAMNEVMLSISALTNHILKIDDEGSEELWPSPIRPSTSPMPWFRRIGDRPASRRRSRPVDHFAHNAT